MPDTPLFEPGQYRFIPAVSQYSGGVVAESGHAIERLRFSRVMPLDEGFAAIEAHLRGIGRPLGALCACELRSPAPFTEQGFRDFNAVYIGTLRAWGLMRDDGVNPVARSNVCPALDPPPQPGFFAFSYTVPSTDRERSFVVAGSAESPEGLGDYRDHAIARGDLSASGLRLKADWVLGEMERRMARLGFVWADATAAQVYTVHDIHPFLSDLLGARGVLQSGLSWHFCRPPVRELEYEMDCRRVVVERMRFV